MVRRFLFLLLIGAVILNSSESIALAQTVTSKGSWDNVLRLKIDSAIRLELISGEQLDGRLVQADQQSLRINAQVSGSAPGILTPRTLSKQEIRAAYRIPVPQQRKLSKAQLLLASAIGLGAGVAVGAIWDSANPGGEDPGSGKLVGGVLGVFAGPGIFALYRAVRGSGSAKLIYRVP